GWSPSSGCPERWVRSRTRGASPGSSRSPARRPRSAPARRRLARSSSRSRRSSRRPTRGRARSWNASGRPWNASPVTCWTGRSSSATSCSTSSTAPGPPEPGRAQGSGRGPVLQPGRDADGEGAPLPGLTLDVDGAADHVGESLAHAEPEPCPRHAPGRAPFDLPERLEDPLPELGLDSDPRVLHADDDLVAGDLRLEPDLASLGELDRVREDVAQDLAQLVRIGVDDRR